MKDFLKSAAPHAMIVVAFFFLTAMYFFPQFQNKVLPAGDTISYEGMAREVKEHKENTGETALWTNSMFGGMPAYQIHVSQKSNLLKYAQKVLKGGMGRPGGFFFLGMICFYILMISLGVNRWLAALGAVCFAFTTNNLVLFEAGHVTKVATLMTAPLVIAGIVNVLKKKYWLGGAIFAFGFGMNVMSNHPQMTYFLGLVMAIPVLIAFVQAGLRKDHKHIGIVSGVLILGVLVGIGASASKLWTTYEYSKDTMRGKPILTAEKTTGSSSEVEGLDWDYAMRWSNGSRDLLSSYIPYAVGGESSHTLGSSSNTVKFLRRKGYQVGKEMRLPTYWGNLPFTSGPIYFGAVIFFLFLFGAFVVRGFLKWGIVGGVLLTFLISLGYNAEFFNTLLFDYFPLFNKFRTPNSVLSVTAIIIPILAILGLHRLFSENEDNEKMLKPIYISGGILGGIALFIALLGPSIFDISNPEDARFIGSLAEQHQQGMADALYADRVALMRSSAWASLAWILVAMGVMFLFVKNYINKTIAMVGIAGLAIVDIFMIDLNYLNQDDFISNRKYKNYFVERPVDAQILRDNDLHYRVHDMSIDTYNSSSSSYFHKTIGGYHAAKLQRIQDVIERHISRGNMKVLNMLNAKYIINTGEGGQAVAQRNTAALGNAWFVNNIVVVNNANQEIDALSDFDPAGDVVVHKEFESYVKGFDPEKSGTIKLVEYTPDYIKYESNSSTDQMAVFSEVWYGPDKGWIAKIDGKEVDYIRANYLLRALKVPSGQHVIEFEFKPQSFYLGEKISLVFSLFSIVFLGFVMYRELRNR